MNRMFLKSIVLITLVSGNLFSQNWQLVWSDEFSGTTINTNNWTHETGGHGWGNNELQYYTNKIENSYIEDGSLVIEARKESNGSYTSARMITSGKQSWKYGRIEARLKLPYGQGLWPAFWMLGDNYNSIGWPQCGEIDIMEMVGGTSGDKVAHGTAHWSHNGTHASYGGSSTLSTGRYADDYHLFTIEWTPLSIKWFVDGKQYHVLNITDSELSEFHQRFFIILNVAVGGDWPGSPDASTVFPQKMYVDYIRVYASESDIPKVTITSPENLDTITPYSDTKITAEIDFDGEIDKVEFYQGEMKIGETSVSPYEMTMRNVFPGCYKITAKAIAKSGYIGTSEVVNLLSGSDCVEAPYYGRPFEIPGEIEVENFNIGASGIAFYDSDVLNKGAAYRLSNQVDIEECSDIHGGYNIGWIETGEWLRYYVNSSKTASYNFECRVAAENAGGKFYIEIDGTNVTGSIDVPSTGGWQTWSTVTVENIEITEGVHFMKIVFAQGGFNLNRIDVYEPNTTPSIELLSPIGGETIGIGTVKEIRWNSVKIKNIKIGLSTNGGSSWQFITQSAPAFYGFFNWKVPDVNSDNCIIMLVDDDNSSIRSLNATPFKIDLVNSVDEEVELPQEFKLYQNYPNPFNPSTTIRFDLKEDSKVTINIYNLIGEKIETLISKEYESGSHSINFDGSKYSSGLLLYRIITPNYVSTKKMLMIK